MAEAAAGEGLFGRQIILRQPARGHRAGTDAILLAAATPKTDGLIVDLGAGVGAAGLLAAARRPKAKLLLLELDPEACRLARENIVANNLEARAAAIEVDALSVAARKKAGLRNGCAAVVIVNPPFFDSARVRSSPDAGKRRAHILKDDRTLADWVATAAALAADGGRVVILHRADRLDALLAACAGCIGGLRILPIHAKAEAPAIRVLLAGQKGAKAPLRLRPGLVLHEDSGAFTSAATALHEGRSELPLF